MKPKERPLNAEKITSSQPEGTLTKRVISGRTYYYYEWKEDGKKRSKTISEEEYLERKATRDKGRMMKIPALSPLAASEPSFSTTVLYGKELKDLVSSVKDFKKRDCYSQIADFLRNPNREKVLVLYGLRRTGKTTLMQQSILEMSDEDFSLCAYIQARVGNTMEDLGADLKLLRGLGYRYIYVDEVTYLDDFIDGAELFSDIYAKMGMKIILSGTDSLGFYLSKNEHLYDRSIFIHTTFIPYREFASVLGRSDIDDYIAYGGTMSKEGVFYNEGQGNETADYLDTAVAKNIQHSLRYYSSGTEFRELKELYDAGELTSAINWVIEDMNHSFALEAINKEFNSHDLGISARNFRNDRLSPNDALDRIDKKTFLEKFKKSLSIVDPAERKVPIEEIHLREIKDYLLLLDFLAEIQIESLPTADKRRKKRVLTQPAIRYSVAKNMVNVILEDPYFNDYTERETALFSERILSEIKGRMLEDIVLLETSKASKEGKVFKLEFPSGEFDMVRTYGNGTGCEIFEIKHSRISTIGQLGSLLDEEKCSLAERKYGPIKRKVLLYRGPDKKENGIDYLNVETFLMSLK